MKWCELRTTRVSINLTSEMVMCDQKWKFGQIFVLRVVVFQIASVAMDRRSQG